MKELIHFTGEWCKPCQAMLPMIEKFLLDNSDIVYTKVDVDDDGSKQLIMDEDILSIPSFVGLVDHKTTGKHVGVATADDLKSLFLER